MRCVAREQHATMAVLLESQRVGFVDRDPDRLPCARFTHHRQQTLDAWHYVFRLNCLFWIFAILELIVDTPDIVGLLVHEHCRAAIAGRVKVRQTFRRSRTVEQDIDNDISAFVARTLQR